MRIGSGVVGVGLVSLDRLGSTGKHFPYGEARGTDSGLFATYSRESATGLDYAQQRYYAPGAGRFLSPDPGGIAAANPSNPQTWNRYSYVLGDPINFNDPSGQLAAIPDAGPYYGNCSGVDSVGVYVDGVFWGCTGGGGGSGGGGGGSACILIGDPFAPAAPNPGCSMPGPSEPEPPTSPVLDCGEALSALGILPTSDTGVALASVLLGENSWSLIGTRQYMNGDAVGHPSGLTITAATVAYEDNLMLDVIANQAKAHHLSLIDQVQAPGVFLGYSVGQSRFNSYQTKSVGSSPCNDLMEVSLAVDSFLIGGGVARSSYNQWRGVVQVNKATKRRFIRHQRPGDLLVGGTDFFTILHP